MNVLRDMPVNVLRDMPVNVLRDMPVNVSRDMPVNVLRDMPDGDCHETRGRSTGIVMMQSCLLYNTQEVLEETQEHFTSCVRYIVTRRGVHSPTVEVSYIIQKKERKKEGSLLTSKARHSPAYDVNRLR